MFPSVNCDQVLNFFALQSAALPQLSAATFEEILASVENIVEAECMTGPESLSPQRKPIEKSAEMDYDDVLDASCLKSCPEEVAGALRSHEKLCSLKGEARSCLLSCGEIVEADLEMHCVCNTGWVIGAEKIDLEKETYCCGDDECREKVKISDNGCQHCSFVYIFEFLTACFVEKHRLPMRWLRIQ
jgi:hypothetical protein